MSKCHSKCAERTPTRRTLEGRSDLEKLHLGNEVWIRPIRKYGVWIGEEQKKSIQVRKTALVDIWEEESYGKRLKQCVEISMTREIKDKARSRKEF